MPKSPEAMKSLLAELMNAKSVDEAADILQSSGYEITAVSAAPEEEVKEGMGDDSGMEDAPDDSPGEGEMPGGMKGPIGIKMLRGIMADKIAGRK